MYSRHSTFASTFIGSLLAGEVLHFVWIVLALATLAFILRAIVYLVPTHWVGEPRETTLGLDGENRSYPPPLSTRGL